LRSVFPRKRSNWDAPAKECTEFLPAVPPEDSEHKKSVTWFVLEESPHAPIIGLNRLGKIFGIEIQRHMDIDVLCPKMKGIPFGQFLLDLLEI
jgi:hypothetical protein